MKPYELTDGDTLVISVNGGAWDTITFSRRDFADMAAATADEIATVVNRVAGMAARAEADGTLVLATAARGGHTSLAVDLAGSNAAAALGLAGGAGEVTGSGLQAARLVSPAQEPFALPDKSGLVLLVDGHRHQVNFDGAITPGAATAAEVARAINGRARGVATAGRDGRVILTSRTVGPQSRLDVRPGRTDGGRTDAAAVLGFTGAAAASEPYPTRPAELVCSGERPALHVLNLTAGPIELHLPEGTVVLPAGAPRARTPAAAGAT
jgi:hypothetical protein